MRALVIGYGSIARRHIQSLRALAEGVEILVYHPGARPDHGPRFVTSLAHALEAKPTIAVIASPPAAHMEALLPLLEAGIPCYVEKPPVATRTELDRLRALRSFPVTLTGCNLRFLPSLKRLREAVRSGSIGTPVRASLQAGQWLPDWRSGTDYRRCYSASAHRGGGVVLDLMHEIDAARWLFGEFEHVRALSGKLSSLEIDSHDVAAIVLGPRPIVSIGLDYVARPPIRRYEIFGDKGTLTWDLVSRRLSRGDEIIDRDPANFDVAATYRVAMQEFVSAVHTGRSTTQELLDGLKSNELALRALAA